MIISERQNSQAEPKFIGDLSSKYFHHCVCSSTCQCPLRLNETTVATAKSSGLDCAQPIARPRTLDISGHRIGRSNMAETNFEGSGSIAPSHASEHHNIHFRQTGSCNRQQSLVSEILKNADQISSRNKLNHDLEPSTLKSTRPLNSVITHDATKMRYCEQSTFAGLFFPVNHLFLLIVSCCLLSLTNITGTLGAQRMLVDQAPSYFSSSLQNSASAYQSHSTSASGPSLCPLTTSCQCKWSNGKQAAYCERRGLISIPSQLPTETQVLDMSGNNLNQLTPYVFRDKHLTNLQKIFLVDCKITVIAEDAFAQLTNLIELDLSHNFLQLLPSRSLEPLGHSLRRLVLSHNSLQFIEANSFESSAQLNTLDLSFNQISLIRPGAFRGLGHLKELKLDDNQLHQLPMNVLEDLPNYLAIDLYGNPWHCDCELKQSIDWMSQHRMQQNMLATCATPQRHKDIRWQNVKPEHYICPPVVLNKNQEIVVGVGSNVTLFCTARGTQPMTFAWFQDERNLTTTRPNGTDQHPSTTKLLDEKRYEIAEEIGQNSTSILFMFNLKITDSSLFLCWVENEAGYTSANYSIIVNDSPPILKTVGGPPERISLISNSDDEEVTMGFWNRLLMIFREESQLGVITVLFLAIVVAAFVFGLVYKNKLNMASSPSRKKPSADMKHNNNNRPIIVNGSGKFASQANGDRQTSRSMLASMDSEDNMSDNRNEGCEDDAESDCNSSSGSASSCRKTNSKVIGAANLNGFMEHLRTGIINMDYHSMSPVIQFNNGNQNGKSNTLRVNKMSGGDAPHMNSHQHQAMHHFQSASNASSIPYYGNGSNSMTTTISDLSPGSSATTFIANPGNMTSAQTLTANNNCDPQHQAQNNHNTINHLNHPHLHHHQFQSHQELNGAPATNTTTTSYTSDYQSGYGEEVGASRIGGPMMAPMYLYEQQASHQPHIGHSYRDGAIYNAAPMIVGTGGPIVAPMTAANTLTDYQHHHHHHHHNHHPHNRHNRQTSNHDSDEFQII